MTGGTVLGREADVAGHAQQDVRRALGRHHAPAVGLVSLSVLSRDCAAACSARSGLAKSTATINAANHPPLLITPAAEMTECEGTTTGRDTGAPVRNGCALGDLQL